MAQGAASGDGEEAGTIQGLNVTVSIYQRAQQADDVVGGSVRTDHLLYSGVKARISNQRPNSLLTQQGFEVKETSEIIIYPDRYPAIQIEDIVIPDNGNHAGARLKVIGVQRSSLRANSTHSHVQLFVERLKHAHMNVPEIP